MHVLLGGCFDQFVRFASPSQYFRLEMFRVIIITQLFSVVDMDALLANLDKLKPYTDVLIENIDTLLPCMFPRKKTT